jgi:hypothetical protein
MPVEHRLDFYFQSHRVCIFRMEDWIDQLIKRYDSSNSDSSSAGQELAKACRMTIECEILGANSQKSNPFNIDYLLGNIMLGGLCMNDKSLCCEALSEVRQYFPLPATVKVIERFGFAQLKSM